MLKYHRGLKKKFLHLFDKKPKIKIMILNFVKTTNLLDWGRLTFGQMAAELQNGKDMENIGRLGEKVWEYMLFYYIV